MARTAWRGPKKRLKPIRGARCESCSNRGSDCENACAAAAGEGCGDSENCEADMCSILDVAPACAAEANAYLGCMATVDPEASFECMEGRTYFISDACNEPFFEAWVACSNP